MTRIKQLALEADEYCRDYVPNWTMDDYNLKFAELIVRECSVAMNPMLRDMVSRGQAVELIKNHFGVK